MVDSELEAIRENLETGDRLERLIFHLVYDDSGPDLISNICTFEWRADTKQHEFLLSSFTPLFISFLLVTTHSSIRIIFYLFVLEKG